MATNPLVITDRVLQEILAVRALQDDAHGPQEYTLVVQRHGPGILTPHEAREKAEAHAEQLGDDLRYLMDWMDGIQPMRHAHQHPGIWDADGSPCDRCARVADIRTRLEV